MSHDSVSGNRAHGSRRRDARDGFFMWLGTLMAFLVLTEWIALLVTAALGLIVIVGYVMGHDVGVEDASHVR